ncbi:MAG: ABC transporter substrate-binding protein [Oscillospiraceae bacterium]|nr:ABC transporter substrate-binding protein [Oscillospiraceae bacterium]
MKKILIWTLLLPALLTGCVRQEEAQPPAAGAAAWEGLHVEHSMELQYASQFSVDYCQGGYKKISIGSDHEYLVIPEGAQIPDGVPEDVTVLQQPLDRIYLVATSAMDLFRALDAVDTITLSGTDASGWYIPEARQAMEAGQMTYAGKYSAPDYELILSQGCDLAVESTMIYHTPEVNEQLERFGIPVLVERSSYESHPLGRVEWLKLYGALLNEEKQAQAVFDGLMEGVAPILEQETTGKTVAFFYLTSNGAVNVRRSGDYIAQAIGLAGGIYLPRNLEEGDNALSTMNIQMETFYEQVQNADILIYNSTIDGELETIGQLLEKSAVLGDFKAVQEGHVWCTGKNLFQESLGLGELIQDLHAVMTEEAPALAYLRPLA